MRSGCCPQAVQKCSEMRFGVEVCIGIVFVCEVYGRWWLLNSWIWTSPAFGHRQHRDSLMRLPRLEFACEDGRENSLPDPKNALEGILNHQMGDEAGETRNLPFMGETMGWITDKDLSEATGGVTCVLQGVNEWHWWGCVTTHVWTCLGLLLLFSPVGIFETAYQKSFFCLKHWLRLRTSHPFLA